MRAIALLLAVYCSGVHAAVPHQINYQGYLTAAGGAPVNATVSMVLNLYNVSTGGSTLYAETQSVSVTNGVFNVIVGSVTPLPLPFDVPYWLGMTVGPDAEMTPRQPVLASAYAIRSATTEALAAGATVPAAQITGAVSSAASFTGALAGDVTGTQTATVVGTVGTVSAANVAAGANLANAATSVNTANTIVKRDASGNFAAGAMTGSSLSLVGGSPPTPRLDVSGSGWFRSDGGALPASASKGVRVFYDAGFGVGSVFAFDYAGGPRDLMLQQPGGNVGIGTPSPGSKLTVAGTIESTSGGVKYPDGNTQTKALANCSAEGDVAIIHLGVWVCQSLRGYVDNGDGTVTDNKTGLMWEQKAACAAADPTKPHCTLNAYTWTSTGTAADGPLYTDFLAKLNLNSSSDGSTECFANHCDWRIPTISELKTIVDCTKTNCVDPVFGPTQASHYWSSSSLASGPSSAWFVAFSNGFVNGDFKNFNNFARAVRSGR